MAEFCFDCFNRMNEWKYKEKDVIISLEKDLCEGCGKRKKIVICPKNGGINDISVTFFKYFFYITHSIKTFIGMGCIHIYNLHLIRKAKRMQKNKNKCKIS